MNIEMEQPQNNLKKILWVILVVGISIFATVAIFLKYPEAESEVTITSDKIVIDGVTYVTQCSMADIKEVSLQSTMPKILRKRGGYDSFSATKKGGFELEKLGIGTLFIHSATGPYLLILKNNGYIMMNFKDKGKTQKIFDDIQKHLPK